jgi:hypothetical protein
MFKDFIVGKQEHATELMSLEQHLVVFETHFAKIIIELQFTHQKVAFDYPK